MFRKVGLFPSRGLWETPTLLDALERVNLNHWLDFSKGPNRVDVSTHLRTETDPVSKTLRSLVL
jgi:hypothetical protein